MSSRDFGISAARPVWARLAAILLLATMAGCASRNLPSCRSDDLAAPGPAGHQASPGRTIVLAAARFDPALVVDDQVVDRNSRPAMSTTLYGNPASGAAIGTLGGMAFCGYFLWFPPLAAACMPVGATAGAIAGGTLGTAGMVYEGTDAGQAEVARQRAYDENTEQRKATQGRVVAAVEPVDLNRLLLQKVRNFAKASDLGDLPELPDQGPRSLDDTPEYRASRDYVLELMVSERTILAAGTNASPTYRFGFSARGRLIRVADNRVVRVFTASAATEMDSGQKWTADNGELLAAQLNAALQKIAETAVDRWLRAALDTAHDTRATVIVIRPHIRQGAMFPAGISIDGCMAGYLFDETFLRIKTSEGKHVIKPERPMGASSRYSFAEFTVQLKPGETLYLRFWDTGGSWELEPTNPQDAEKFVETHFHSGDEPAFPTR